MVFVKGGDDETIFIMLAEKDVQNMRQGRTVFIDDRMTNGDTFKKVIISSHKTDQESVELLRRVGVAIPATMSNPEPRYDEEVCSSCKGIMFPHSLFEGKCIVCWATMAKMLQQAAN